MKNMIFAVSLIFTAAPSALLAGALEDLSAMAGSQLPGPGSSVSLPVADPAEAAGGTQPQAAARPATYSSTVPLYFGGEEHMAAVSKKLEAAGYVVLSSWVLSPEDYPILEWYTYSLKYEALPGGVTHEFLKKRGQRVDSEEAAKEAGALAVKELEAAGYAILSFTTQPEYLPFEGWFFHIDYILPAKAA